jgi:pyruvate/2-oxoglutarate dehydrogenase complex dihydrolipoamide acyltransferase (E2) component
MCFIKSLSYSSKQDAYVSKVFVKKNDKVIKGDKIIEISYLKTVLGFFYKRITDIVYANKSGSINVFVVEKQRIKQEQEVAKIHSIEKGINVNDLILSPNQKVFNLPSVGEDIGSVTISKWLVKEGNCVDINQSVAEIDTDKATLELSVETSGIITFLKKEGDVIYTNSPLYIIEETINETKPISKIKKKIPSTLTRKTTFLVPHIEDSISEVEILKWLVQDGDYVRKDQSIAEVDCDIVTLELPAEDSGYIKLLKKEGDFAQIGEEVYSLNIKK